MPRSLVLWPINPIAGMGGTFGLEGTDDVAEEARSRGAHRRYRLSLSKRRLAMASYTTPGDTNALVRGDNGLPELSELDVVRHFQHLSQRNFGIDNGFYPLGSCT